MKRRRRFGLPSTESPAHKDLCSGLRRIQSGVALRHRTPKVECDLEVLTHKSATTYFLLSALL